MKKQKAYMPGMQTLLRMAYSIDVPTSYSNNSTPEVKRLEREASRLRASLLNNPQLKALDKKAQMARRKAIRAVESRRKQKWAIINSIKLNGVTPAAVTKVKKLIGLKD